MRREAVFAIALCACQNPPTPTPAPAPPPEEPAHAQALYEIHLVHREGWNGRVIVARATGAIRALASPSPRPLSQIVSAASIERPFVAINGGFYDLDNRPMGLVVSDGREISPRTPNGGSGIFVVREGRASVVQRDAFDGADVQQAMQSIDRLVDEGHSLVGDGSNRRAARSAVAIDAAGNVFFVVAFDEQAVDHESEAVIQLDDDSGATGPTMREMSELLIGAEMGVHAAQALGLDGGFSTSLLVKSDGRSLSVVAYAATIGALVSH